MNFFIHLFIQTLIRHLGVSCLEYYILVSVFWSICTGISVGYIPNNEITGLKGVYIYLA